MIRKLLAFSRREQLTRRAVDPVMLIGDLLRTLRLALPESITCELDAPVLVPEIDADRGAVEQMLLNLANNARDAMPQGGTLRVSVYPEPFTAGFEAPEVEISVQDTGEGMDDGVRARLFEPFFTTKPAGRGTGLGMAMVYGLMQQHGGTVRVESTLGMGTTVRLRFRRAAGQLGPDAKRVAPAKIRGGSETILLVEDEDALRRAATRILERFGYRVLAARDGVEALELFRTHRDAVALVVSDVVMPRMGGEELLAVLHRERPGLPVFLATGYTQTDLSGPAQAASGVWFIQKPWTADELLALAREVLDRAAPSQLS
jgi:CheY-like chemotaxis protein/anti-sigma regulatory factor (Ser/Thr protein kinase)